MKTRKEYIESLRKLDLEVYADGKRIKNIPDHPLFKPHVNSASLTYELAHIDEYKDLMTAESIITGKRINRFTHIHQSTDDLLKKVKMLRMISQKTGTCYQRCVGFDAMNATFTNTYDIDKEMGTNYHERFRKYLEYVQENDLMVAGAMTDPKGDRGKRPSDQADPDMFVRVVDENEDGIIIRGAKVHMTGMVNSHEMLVMPTAAMKEQDKAYAVCCALPTDAKGVLHIFGKQTNDGRKYGEIDQGNAKFGIVGGEALTVFDDVFVPWDRVFMNGEYQFSGDLVARFASYHRQNYGGCKGGVSDVVVGATALLAQYNGVLGASHIQDKLAEMIHLTETLFACSLACSVEGTKTESGSYYVDPLLANVVKQNITRHIYEIDRIAQDIAGGFLATLPSEDDLKDPKLGKYVKKYFKGIDGVDAIDRIRIARLLENMTGGTALVESMHGAGPPQSQKIMITRQGEIPRKADFAKQIAGITECNECLECDQCWIVEKDVE